jgi:hypothetical protein
MVEQTLIKKIPISIDFDEIQGSAWDELIKTIYLIKTHFYSRLELLPLRCNLPALGKAMIAQREGECVGPRPKTCFISPSNLFL